MGFGDDQQHDPDPRGEQAKRNYQCQRGDNTDYDNNGNLTKDENDNRFVYDAWNRLVQIKNSSNTVIATNAFDGLNRKAKVTTSSGTIDRVFSSDWQVLEEKSGSNTKNRYIWSPAYTDALVLRDRDTDSNGTLDERLFPLQDANWNTTALVNTSGTVQERFTYSPFGVVTFRDSTGSILSASAKDWVFLHQGGERIAAGNYDFRNRIYSPTLGRWLTNDPLGFDAGDVNTFRYVGNGPGNGLDPLGLERKDFLPNGGPNWWMEGDKDNSQTPSPFPGIPILVGIISGGMIYVGSPLIPKPPYFGSFPWTSIGSVLIAKGKAIPLPWQFPTFVGGKLKYTIWPGRVLSRWIPYVGWVILTWDVINIVRENANEDYKRYYGAWDHPDWYYFREKLYNGNGQKMYGPGEGSGRR